MRSVAWFLLFVFGLFGVVGPLVYLHTASQLPALETEFDLERLLKYSIEGERLGMRLGQYGGRAQGVEFEKPDFTRLPKDFVALFLVQLGCPGYFQSPREEGWAWRSRLLWALVSRDRPGDGRCELSLARRLAQAVGAKGTLGELVAAHRIRGFLEKDQLIAYELGAMNFERAVIGVEDAARLLFQKKLQELELSELAELSLTLPGVGNHWPSVKSCKNAALIRQNRDVLLAALVDNALVPADRAQAARARPVACAPTP